MKLEKALEIGKDCELLNVGEAMLNIRLRAINLFCYGEEKSELNEMNEDFRKSGLTEETSIEEALAKLKEK